MVLKKLVFYIRVFKDVDTGNLTLRIYNKKARNKEVVTLYPNEVIDVITKTLRKNIQKVPMATVDEIKERLRKRTFMLRRHTTDKNLENVEELTEALKVAIEREEISEVMQATGKKEVAKHGVK